MSESGDKTRRLIKMGDLYKGGETMRVKVRSV